MNASKSRRQGARRYRKHAENLRQKIQGELGEKVKFTGATDGVKMSVVLENFIEPYMKFADTRENLDKLLMIALLAWNISLLPRNIQKESLAKAVGQLPPEIQADAQGILQQLMRRKRSHFAQFRRAIINYEIIDEGDGFYLQVASTPEAM